MKKIGDIVKNLIIRDIIQNGKRKHAIYFCNDCKVETKIRLDNPNPKCPCARKTNIKDQRFGRLTARYITAHRGANRCIMWMCECDCGNWVEVVSASLRNENTTSCGCFMREVNSHPPGIAALNHAFYSYKNGAKDRKFEFSFSIEEFVEITQQKCHYCNDKPSTEYYKHKAVNGVYLANGIDRVDNTKGYTKENSVSCCKICNRAKHTMSYEKFINWLDKIANFRKK